MSICYSPRHRFSEDIDSERVEMESFSSLRLDHPNRREIHANLQGRLRYLLDCLRSEYTSFEGRIHELKEEISSPSAGGGRMEVMRDNMLGEILAEIEVLSRQQESLSTSMNTVSIWGGELRQARWP
ncbi:uncharacterized protein EAF01_007620 [Botrytis porri]|uniref:Uncharacterized protein n=1 Tax=Botrytis porri TaxID=87229 RepID=A0A4Z1KPP6_9HELO|nr:uncharacterized protein EAF01_007620 [Botrytis porri]KAF7900318.1 hypothetical protein EAF01_007620 [Botrytis porri]TGO87488.1 hypothetical protein BPOR_0222g00030 [Botrytis porri]